MSKNKYILLFEAFSAKTISKTLAFLDKEVGKGESSKFIEVVKNLAGGYDIPIDKIDDSYFEYLGKKDAVMVKPDGVVNNIDGIFCLKYWFSLDKGYLGYTYTGNVVKKKEEARRTRRPEQKITPSDLRELGITKGTVLTLDRVRDLKTGDKLLGIFSDDESGPLQIATAFVVPSGGGYFAIQELAEGSSPDGIDSSEWRKYGRRSWSIGNRYGDKNSDSLKLSKYIDDGSELNIDGVLVEPLIAPTKIEQTVNVMEFNLPMSGKAPRSWWHESFNSIAEEDFKIADFAIILYYDKLYQSDMKRPSAIKKERDESKSGAYALLDDKTIRQANIDRYFDKMCKNLGLDYEKDFSPRNMEKILLKALNGKLALYNIHWRGAGDKIYRVINDISRLVDEYEQNSKPLTERGKEKVKYRYDSLIGRIKEIYGTRDIARDNKKVGDVMAKLKKNGFEEEYNIMQRILSIGEYMSNSLVSNPINTMEDLRLVNIKLNSIAEVLQNEHLKLTRGVYAALDNLAYEDNDTYVSFTEIKRMEGIEKANKRIDLLEKYIKSIL